jgi:hypothetical protein
MNWKKTGSLFAFVLLFNLAKAQQFGGFPPSTRWKQINTDTSRIIFSSGSESQAERIASIVQRMAADTSYDLGEGLRKINIVLHNRTTLANGYVALGPFRSEFYLVPGSSIFDFGNIPWQENLAIHEYRHVQQYNNFNRGLTKAFRFLLGEQGQDLANALTIPDWFFEGDAVFAETAYSRQGRGRLPYFLSGYNSLAIEGKNYSWMKLRNGSLKDYVPNHYQLGYLMTNYGYQKYGEDFWKNVTRDASSFKGLFYPFQRAVKKYSGTEYKTFRQEALASSLGNLKKETKDPAQKQRTVTHYYFPTQVSSDSLVYLKKAYDKIPAFYLQTPAGEKKLTLQNISSEEWFSYRSGLIAYTAFSTNPRWSLVNFSDIILYDLASGLEVKLTSGERYYTPDISPDLGSVVAIKMNDSLQTELRMVDVLTGESKTLFAANDEDFFIHPRFVDQENIVVGVRDPAARISFRMLHLPSGKWQDILPPSYYTTGLPFVDGKRIYFVSNITGNDEIYVFSLENRKIHQLTQDQTGNYFPSASGDSIVWSHFTTNGIDLRRSSLDKMLWKEVSETEWQKGRSPMEPAFTKNLLAIETKRFPHKRYSRSTGLFNFHSWRPTFNDPGFWNFDWNQDGSDPEFNLSVYSDNVLNTFSNEFFYRYNRNESSNAVGWNAFYGGLFPVVTVGIEQIFNRSFPLRGKSLDLDQFEMRAGLQVPLNLTSGNFYKNFTFGSNYVFSRLTPKGYFRDSFPVRNTPYLSHFIGWSHYLPRAVQHIFPKFGWTTLLQQRHRINAKGFQFLGSGSLFLPSIRNHSLVINAMVQETDTSNIVFSNRFAISRGYGDYFLSRMWKFAGNYHLPLLYPDMGLASIAYIQRIRANLFYDFTRGYSRNKSVSRDFRSIGTEIYFDTKWWNQLPVSFGFRVSHLLDNGLLAGEGKGSTFFEFILPVGLIN